MSGLVHQWATNLRFQQDVEVTVRVARNRDAVEGTRMGRVVAAVASGLEACAAGLKYCSRRLRTLSAAEVYEGTGVGCKLVEASTLAHANLVDAWRSNAVAETLRIKDEKNEMKRNEARGHFFRGWFAFCVTQFTKKLDGRLPFRQVDTAELNEFVDTHIAHASDSDRKEEYVLGLDTEGKNATYMQISAGDLCDTVVFGTSRENIRAIRRLLVQSKVIIAVVGDESSKLAELFDEEACALFAPKMVDVQRLAHGINGTPPSLARLVAAMCGANTHLSKFAQGTSDSARNEAYAGFQSVAPTPIALCAELLLYAALDAIATNLLYKHFGPGTRK